MRNILFLIFAHLLLQAPLSAIAASPFDIDQCIERGLTENHQVKAYRLAVDAASEGISEAWGAFLPTLSIDYSKNQLDKNGGNDRDADYLSQQSDSLSIRLSQPLFTGLAGTAGLQKARQSKRYQEYELQFIQQHLVREIRTSFYDILRARQLVRNWSESVSRLEDQREIAKAWVDQELAPRLRLLETEVELFNAHQQLASARAERAIAEAELRERMALPPEEGLLLEGRLLQEDFSACDSVAACLDAAFKNRPELEMASLNSAMARQDAKTIRARNLPQVSFDAGWVDYQRDFERQDLIDDERDYYTLTLNLRMRPFQGGTNIFAYRRQQLQVKRLGHEQASRRQTIATEVHTRFELLLAGKSRLSSATRGVEEAQEAYQFSDRAAKLGVISLDELLSAELRLTQANINKVNAEHALQQARVQLDYVVGKRWLAP